MGIQVFIKTQDLLNAGAAIQYESKKVFGFVCLVSGEDIYKSEVGAHLTFPCGEEAWMHVAPSGSLWTDFNHWGDNRAHLEPLLRRHGIPFVEV